MAVAADPDTLSTPSPPPSTRMISSHERHPLADLAPFTQHALHGAMTKIVRGEGAYLFTEDGRRIVDAISSWWVVTRTAIAIPAIVAAIHEQQAPLLSQIIFAGYTHEPAEQVARLLLPGRRRPASTTCSSPTAARPASKWR
ncbi:MAG: aminotransferase class III-fold pyridoxal phosphate-dependent enzyme [Rhodopseudomonas palustris]|nr:aminotransferase class III-fold pyridoxal phosphate-dependent enzyme [Rhodopseudomonas palustris]